MEAEENNQEREPDPVKDQVIRTLLPQPSRRSFLQCITINARSIVNKLNELHGLLYHADYDIVFITESWLSDAIPNSLIDPENEYNVIRKDRKASRGGGVCLLIRKNVLTHVVNVAAGNLEVVAADVYYSNFSYRLIGVYRKPGYLSDDVNYVADLIACLTRLCDTTLPVIITGDFNCPDIDWATMSAPRDGVQNHIAEFINDSGLSQLVSKPTRCRNIIDLLIVSQPILVSQVNIKAPFANSDHNTVTFALSFENENESENGPARKPTIKCYKWNEADYSAIAAYLDSIDWNTF